MTMTICSRYYSEVGLFETKWRSCDNGLLDGLICKEIIIRCACLVETIKALVDPSWITIDLGMTFKPRTINSRSSTDEDNVHSYQFSCFLLEVILGKHVKGLAIMEQLSFIDNLFYKQTLITYFKYQNNKNI